MSCDFDPEKQKYGTSKSSTIPSLEDVKCLFQFVFLVPNIMTQIPYAHLQGRNYMVHDHPPSKQKCDITLPFHESLKFRFHASPFPEAYGRKQKKKATHLRISSMAWAWLTSLGTVLKKCGKRSRLLSEGVVAMYEICGTENSLSIEATCATHAVLSG